MKKVLALAAFGEAATGLVLAAYPPLVVRLLFGARIDGAGGMMSRIAGFALVGLGIACWPGRAGGAFDGMLTYSALAMLYLVYVGLSGGDVGLLLWPAVLAHALIVMLLLRARFQERRTSIEQIGANTHR